MLSLHHNGSVRASASERTKRATRKRPKADPDAGGLPRVMDPELKRDRGDPESNGLDLITMCYVL